MTAKHTACSSIVARMLVALSIIAGPFDLGCAAPPPQHTNRPFESCNELNGGFVLLGTHPGFLGRKALRDWSDDDIEYTRLQIAGCLSRGQLRQKDAERYGTAFEAQIPAIHEARAQQEEMRQQEMGRARHEQQQAAAAQGLLHAEAMAKLQQVAIELRDYPPEGVPNLQQALVLLNKLKSTADAARLKVDSTIVDDDRLAYAVQNSVDQRIESYRKLLQQKCTSQLREIGIPRAWTDEATQLTFSTGYEEQIAPLLCVWAQRGVKITYSGGIPMLTGPSLTLRKPGSDAIELSLSETHQNGVTFIVPTAYSGPDGSITVRTARDLQQIYALLIQVGR